MTPLPRAEVERIRDDVEGARFAIEDEQVRDLADTCLALMDEAESLADSLEGTSAVQTSVEEELDFALNNLRTAEARIRELEGNLSDARNLVNDGYVAEEIYMARISRLERVAEAAKAYLDAEDRHANDPDYNTAESLVLTNGVLVHALDALSEPQDGEGGEPDHVCELDCVVRGADAHATTSPPAEPSENVKGDGE